MDIAVQEVYCGVLLGSTSVGKGRRQDQAEGGAGWQCFHNKGLSQTHSKLWTLGGPSELGLGALVMERTSCISQSLAADCPEEMANNGTLSSWGIVFRSWRGRLMVHTEATRGGLCDNPWGGEVQSKLKSRIFTLQKERTGMACGECPRRRKQNVQITENEREHGKIRNVNSTLMDQSFSMSILSASVWWRETGKL